MQWLKGAGISLSEHFNSREFECPCSACTLQVIKPELVEKLELLRATLGAPITITGGFRCAAHQEHLRQSGFPTSKGVSQHELGGAADITCQPEHFKALVRHARDIFKAVGEAETWAHVDTRSDTTRYWNY